MPYTFAGITLDTREKRTPALIRTYRAVPSGRAGTIPSIPIVTSATGDLGTAFKGVASVDTMVVGTPLVHQKCPRGVSLYETLWELLLRPR
jgi:hypothetical protein